MDRESRGRGCAPLPRVLSPGPRSTAVRRRAAAGAVRDEARRRVPRGPRLRSGHRLQEFRGPSVLTTKVAKYDEGHENKHIIFVFFVGSGELRGYFFSSSAL